MTLPGDPTAAGRARKLTARVCTAAGLPTELRDTALLLTSEIVTNAVLHGRSQVLLTVIAGPLNLRVEVGDDNSRRPFLHPHHDPDALDGRGLLIVDACATAWGVTPAGYGKIVWFEVSSSSTTSQSVSSTPEGVATRERSAGLIGGHAL